MNEATILNDRKVRIAALAVLTVLALFLLAKVVQEVRAFGSPVMSNQITIEAEGKATAIPNIATVSFFVSEERGTVAEAQKLVTEKMNKALKAVNDLGVEEKDVQTTNYQIYAQYEYDPCYPGSYCTNNSRIRGYAVTQNVSVKVRDTAKVGDVLANLGEIGVSGLNGPSFAIDDLEALRAEARAKAVAAAKEKAQALAKDLGVSLGDVVSFWEQQNYGYPMPYDYGGGITAKAESAPSVPAGENEITVRVSVSYQIR